MDAERSHATSERSSNAAALAQHDREPQGAEARTGEVYRLTLLREHVMWDALATLGDQLSDAVERQEARPTLARISPPTARSRSGWAKCKKESSRSTAPPIKCGLLRRFRRIYDSDAHR